MDINFARGAWNLDDVTYAYSYRFEETHEFIQRDDCVENQRCSDARYGFDYISLMSRKTYKAGAKITTRCAFEGEAAPLIVVADKMYTDERGVVRFGEYYEIVIWQNGMNVWRMVMKDGKVTWKKAMGITYPLAHGDIHEFSVEVLEERLNIVVDGQPMTLLTEGMYHSFHLGVNACEGICRFYDMKIEGETVERF